MFDKIIPEAYLVDLAVPNIHILQCSITKKIQKYTDRKEGLI